MGILQKIHKSKAKQIESFLYTFTTVQINQLATDTLIYDVEVYSFPIHYRGIEKIEFDYFD